MDLICDSVLKKWFQAREEELAVIDENDKEFLKQDDANRGMKQKLFFKIILWGFFYYIKFCILVNKKR